MNFELADLSGTFKGNNIPCSKQTMLSKFIRSLRSTIKIKSM